MSVFITCIILFIAMKLLNVNTWAEVAKFVIVFLITVFIWSFIKAVVLKIRSTNEGENKHERFR